MKIKVAVKGMLQAGLYPHDVCYTQSNSDY
jgi:hypothetical protein